jgi:Schlafen, AlbA_2
MLPPEDSRNEYKEQWSDSALKDACAFANSDTGGRITLGVDDDGRVVGFAWRDDTEQQTAVNKLCALEGMKRKPTIEIGLHDGRVVLIIEIKPDYAVVKYSGRAYTRVGSTSREMTKVEEDILSRRRDSSWTRIARLLGLEHQSVCGVNAIVLLLLGIALVGVGIVATTLIAAKYEALGARLPFGQKVSWWAGTLAILIPSTIGIIAATQERFGWVRHVVLGLSILMWVLFAVDGYFEGVRLGLL